MRVDRGDEHAILPERHAAIRRMQLQQIFGKVLLVAPDEVTGLRAERDDLLLRRRDEHDAVVDDRRRLMALGHAGGVAPHRHQLPDVGRRDLIERAVTPTTIVAAVHEPVVRLGIEQPLLGHGRVADGALGPEHRGREQGECGGDASQRSHRHRCGLLCGCRRIMPRRTRSPAARRSRRRRRARHRRS